MDAVGCVVFLNLIKNNAIHSDLPNLAFCKKAKTKRVFLTGTPFFRRRSLVILSHFQQNVVECGGVAAL